MCALRPKNKHAQGEEFVKSPPFYHKGKVFILFVKSLYTFPHVENSVESVDKPPILGLFFPKQAMYKQSFQLYVENLPQNYLFILKCQGAIYHEKIVENS